MVNEGAELALLLLGGFRALVEQAQEQLEQHGHPGVRPVHEFALRAVAEGAGTTSELARELGVTKQAAAKTVAFLLERGYLDQGHDAHDARRKTLAVTQLGNDLLTLGQQLFDGLRERWAARIGDRELDAIQSHLRDLVSTGTTRFDTAGWLSAP
ncbi:MarR family winged helix-turn-helix transcriptional regulator [Actinomycetospora chiangmaiensis]|uniref:MarR family winged helix-turn-helix transcriptional regulator n=1 Tax=Actinomycetospora chiangmaiensis TaxID=402650 RepID=UPI000381A480|nr:helix-turn-helix domain-containing protein [Actinomycetospora chiangmaiensis]